MYPIKFSFLLALCACLASAAGTRVWDHSTQADFDKGTLDRLSLSSGGRITLAPTFQEIHDPGVPALWAIVEDSMGRVYYGGGGPGSSAKVLTLDAPGQARLLSDLPGLQVQALAVDRQDRLYAATSPDGKVYRIAAGGRSEVFYDPKAKYIWALAFNAQGDLFVATGDEGKIHKVNAAGSGAVFFETEQAHARSLIFDKSGNLIAGTDPGGLVLRINPSGQGFVLYQFSKREVTSLAIDTGGAVYAAAVGARQAATAPPAPSPVPISAAPPPAPAQAAPGVISAGRPVSVSPPIPTFSTTVSGGSEIYRIETSGYPKKVWTHPSDIVYAIALDSENRPLAGTGNKGAIYRLDSDQVSTLLRSASPTQITALCRLRDGRVLAGTGNIGKLYRLGPGIESQGSYVSEALDADSFTYWGRLRWEGALNGAQVKIETRSGNLDTPQKNWSEWAAIPLGSDYGRVASPPARFIQYRVTLTAGADNASPTLSRVELAHRQKNIAPVVEIVEATPFNYKFPPQTLTITPSQSLTLQPLSRQPKPAQPAIALAAAATIMQYAKGHAGIRWLAEDANGDDLSAKVELRGAAESGWRLLKDGIRDKGYSLDGSAFADGAYVARVTVTDTPDNPPSEALSGSLESAPFVIDNTPPRISGLAGTRSELRWKASDALNAIDKAEYSINGGDWQVVLPTTGISDSRDHDYVLPLTNPPAGELTIAVRVTDDFDNQAVEKITVR
jgi:hypothetical protein